VRLKHEDRKAGGSSGAGQPLVRTNEFSPRRLLLAPDQRSSKLKTVGGSQQVFFQGFPGKGAQLVVRENLPPGSIEQLQASQSALFVEFGDSFLPVKPADRAMHFDKAPPPNDGGEFSDEGVGLATGGFVNAERGESASVPESGGTLQGV
jgi:hypothetical protein